MFHLDHVPEPVPAPTPSMSHLYPRIEQSVEEIHHWVRRNCATAQTKLDATLRQANTSLNAAGIKPKHLLYGVLAVLTLAWATSVLVRRIFARKGRVSRPSSPDLEKRSPFKAPPREPGGKCHRSHTGIDLQAPLSMAAQLLQTPYRTPLPQLVRHN
jgi:hypothetical protein